MYIQAKKTDSIENSGVVFTSINNEGMIVELFDEQPEGVLISNREEFAALEKDVIFVTSQELMQQLGRI